MEGRDLTAPADDRLSFGRYLQAYRIEKGIRLERVAEETRIGLGTLEAIEQEDFARLPPDVFLIGFMRAFAGSVGADGEEAVQRYRSLRATALRTEQADREPEKIRAGLGGKLILCLALWGALVVLTLFGFARLKPHASEAAVRSETAPLAGALVVAGESSGPPPPPVEETGDKPPAAAFVLLVRAREDSWIKAVIDQGNPWEKTLKAGDELRVEAHADFNLLIGNAGGVRLILNDKPVPVPGKRGEVVNIHLP
jgi:transcriptional regulator with XRE-family HTH domain